MDERWILIGANPPSDTNEIPLPENAFGAMIAWVAGPQWARPASAQAPSLIRIETHQPNTSTTVEYRSRSAQDQSSIDDDIADFLRAADMPLPPRGVVWALSRPPRLHPQSFWAQLHIRMDDACPHIRFPRETLSCIETVLPDVLEPAPNA